MKKEFVIFGRHAVKAALHEHPENVTSLIIQQGAQSRLKSLILLAEKKQIPIRYASRTVLEQTAPHQRHQGVIALCQERRLTQLQDESTLLALVDNNDPLLLLILDGITDPHNFGACLRSADAAGVTAVVIPKDKSVGITPVVRKVACGAAETLPIFAVTNLARTLKRLQTDAGFWVVGLAGEATTSLYEADLSGRVALVMGSEGKGLRRLTRETCDRLVKIPMYGQVESLNVSVATGIALFEAVRQRHTSTAKPAHT